MAIIKSDEAIREYQAARVRAEQLSNDGCTYHVNADVMVHQSTGEIRIGFGVSDWYVSGQTVASFSDGTER